jgi:hypothetical protein
MPVSSYLFDFDAIMKVGERIYVIIAKEERD